MSNHLITQYTIELQFPDTEQDAAREIQDEFMRMYHELLLRELEKLFDEMAPGSDVIIIDRLEVFLGTFEKIENLTASIRNIVGELLRKILFETAQAEDGRAVIYLNDEAGHSFTVHAERRSPVLQDEYVLLHFLQYGIALPAAADKPMRERAATLLRLTPATWKRIVFQLNDYKRLTLQFEESFLRELFFAVFDTAGKIIPLLESFRKLLPGMNAAVLWQLAFENATAGVEIFIENLAVSLTADDWKSVAGNISAAPAAAELLLKQKNEMEEFVFHETATVFSITIIRLLKDWENLIRAAGVKATVSISAQLDQLKNLLSELLHAADDGGGSRSTVLQLLQLRISELLPAVSGTVLHDPILKLETAVKKELIRKNDDEIQIPEEPIYTAHAGLVLLFPYLVAYFDNIGLLDGDDFKNEQARLVAVAALHYAATGLNAPAEEHQLVFHKIICGIPLLQPIPEIENINQEICDETDAMLDAFIQNWEALKLTTVGEVRTRFLQRNGKLQHDGENNWSLHVESESIDVLIDSLSYSINRLELPWLKAPLFTQW